MHNWRRYPSSNWYEIDQKRGSKFGALLWRHLTPKRKPQHRCTTTVHPVYKCPKKFFGKFTSCRTFGAHKLVHSEPFLDNLYEVRHLMSALGRDVRKIFLYRCTSTFSALNKGGGIFFKCLSYLYEVVRTNFSADFWTFRNF